MATTMDDAMLVDWFSRWRKPISHWLRNRASVPRLHVDDLCQEIFVRLLRYPSQKVVENPQGYLFRIAANVANEWRERARVRCPHEDTWLETLEISLDDQPENIHEREQFVKSVQAAVAKLPPRAQEFLTMHVHGQMTYKQIAAAKKVTYRIVLRDLTRAYSALRFEFEGERE
jgi:RNA polymerase sigma factor (sigma-70 family)